MVLRSACMPNTIWQAPGRRRPVARRTERSAPRACPSPEALKEASLQGTALSTGSGSTTRLSRYLLPTQPASYRCEVCGSPQASAAAFTPGSAVHFYRMPTASIHTL